MLELRPNCECCDKDLPVDSTEAMICTYECTFCKDCVDNILSDVCPNCGGGFTLRPIRPCKEYRDGVSVVQQPQSEKRINTKYTKQQLLDFAENIKHIAPNKR